MSERRTLTIEPNYCDSWSITDAIREIIQNAIDAGTKFSCEQHGLSCKISDNGVGIKMSDFIIGRSSKQDDKDAIGQFGEGLKIGCLVLARENRKVHILSLNKRYDFSIQYDDTWQEKLLTIDIEDNPIEKVGTSVYIECSEDEVNQARNLFLKLNSQPVIDKLPHKVKILDAPGIIYVNGLAVTKIVSLYGYNFSHKDLVNRDRMAIGHTQIRNHISEALSSTANTDIISNLLSTAITKVNEGTIPAEFDVIFAPRKNTWLKVIKMLYGNRVCLSSHNPRTDLAAIEKNWKVLDMPWSFWHSLRYIIPNSDAVIKDKKRTIPFNKLMAEQKEFFNRGKMIVNEIAIEAGLKTYPIKIFVDAGNENNAQFSNFGQTGYFCNGVAGVCYKTIQNADMGKFVGTVIHEFIHGNSGHSDNTRAFENSLTDAVASLGLAWYIEKHKKRIGLDYSLKGGTDAI